MRTTGTITTYAGSGPPGQTGTYGGDGGPATAASVKFYNPNGLFLAPDGSLYIADSANCRIRRVDPRGYISTVAGNGPCAYGGDGGPATAASLNLPHAMVVDHDGNLIIADRINNRIRKVGLDGTIQTIAGTGTAGFKGDGALATAAQLSNPQGLAIGPDGTLYVADHDNAPDPQRPPRLAAARGEHVDGRGRRGDRLRRVRERDEGHRAGDDPVRLRGGAVRQGHGARAVRGAGLRCERREVDREGSDSVQWPFQ